MKVNKYVIKNNMDPESVDNVKESIGGHSGINAVRIDLLANTVTVDFDDDKVNDNDIKNIIGNAGLSIKNIKSGEELY